MRKNLAKSLYKISKIVMESMRQIGPMGTVGTMGMKGTGCNMQPKGSKTGLMRGETLSSVKKWGGGKQENV